MLLQELKRDGDSKESHPFSGAVIVLVALAPAPSPGDTMHEGVVTRSTIACHTPFDAIAASQGECHRLNAGQHVTVVADEGDYSCVVYAGVQRCMWVHRDTVK